MGRTKTLCLSATRFFLLCCSAFLWSSTVSAQMADSNYIEAKSIRFSKLISSSCSFAESPKKLLNPEEIKSLSYQNIAFAKFHPNLPLKYMEKNLILRFAIANLRDTAKYNLKADTVEWLYFMPGFYFRNMHIYKSDSVGVIRDFTDSATRSKIYPGAYLIKVEPGEKAVYYACFNFIRTNANAFAPYLIEQDYLRFWLSNFKNRDPSIHVTTYIICGILLLMILYSLAVYTQSRSREFLFYIVYTLCSTVLFFTKSNSRMDFSKWNFFYEEYADFIILCFGVYFYLIFVRSFINTKERHPKLHIFLKIAQRILVAFLLVFSGIYFFTEQFVSMYVLENYIIKVYLFCIGVVFVWYSSTRRDRLLSYLAAGNFALLAFSIMSLLMLLGIKFNAGSIFNNGLIYYEVGVALELLFFLMGLAYKNRRDLTEQVLERERFKLENERKEFEKQIAIVTTRQEERDRISADMHDELGSGMTAIRLMSEIVKTKMKDQAFPELEKISNSANDLLGKMNSIIWTMKSSNDSLESLVAYIRAHAIEYFDSTPLSCKVLVPESIPSIEMSGEKRRNIFLSVKESLNNIMKHAQASEVTIQISIHPKELVIQVADNGVGIDTEKLRRFGNGLSNMKRRMESINGDFNVENNGGSIITFTSPL